MYHLLTSKGSTEGIGGCEVQTLFIANEFARRNYDVSAITFSFDHDTLKEQPPFTVIEAFDREAGLPILGFYYPRLFRLWKALRKADADVYYINVSGFLLAPVVAFAKAHGRRVVFWGASSTDFDPGKIRLNRRDKWLFFWGLKRCDVVFAQSEFQKELVRKYFGREVRVLYNAIPGKNSTNGSRKIILWVGGVRRVKNPHHFVELASKFPNERFVLVGGLKPVTDDEMREYYSRLLDRAKQVPNLEMTGYVPLDEADRYFEEAKVLVNTSELEGFPLAFLQAWARGIPVLSFVGVDDIVEKNKLGLIATDPDDMARKLDDMLSSKLSFSSQHIKTFFDANCTVERAVDVFEETLGLAARN